MLVVLLAVRAAAAAAVDYTDIWYAPAEPGWGVNLVQSDGFLFTTFFVFAQGGAPTWYTGQLNWDGTSKFSGGLYASTGTWFATVPWVAGNTSAAGTRCRSSPQRAPHTRARSCIRSTARARSPRQSNVRHSRRFRSGASTRAGSRARTRVAQAAETMATTSTGTISR